MNDNTGLALWVLEAYHAPFVPGGSNVTLCGVYADIEQAAKRAEQLVGEPLRWMAENPLAPYVTFKQPKTVMEIHEFIIWRTTINAPMGLHDAKLPERADDAR